MSTAPPPSPTPTESFTPPSWAHPSHSIFTPRMILRSSIPSDAEATCAIFADPLNSPFGGIVGAQKTVEERRELLAKRVAEAMKGENAFLVCVLTDLVGFEEVVKKPSIQALKVHDGYLIGMSGFNEFALRPNPAPSTTSTKPQVLITNTGALIHHPFSRRGLAMESLQATIEYSIHVLDCDVIEAETDSINLPFKTLMKGMGLDGLAKEGKKTGTDENGLDGAPETEYSFSREDWGVAKKGMMERGKWYL